MQNQEKKPAFNFLEGFFLITFALISDLINWIPVLNLIVTFLTLPAFQLYFILKKAKGVYSLAGNLAELIPGISILPAVTLGVLTTILITNKLAKAETLAPLIKK